MTTEPVAKIKGGRGITAAIFKNESNGKAWYITDYYRTFKNSDGKFETYRKFDEAENLVVGFLTQQAHAKIQELKATDRANMQEAA